MIDKNNPIPYKLRLKELLFDYLLIVVYLALLFGVVMTGYIFLFDGVPEMDEFASQLIALFTSVVPVVLIFSYLDYSKGGSFGKRKSGLKLVYREKSFKSSLIRNCVKFLPWQIGHMSTIHGIYSNFDLLAIILFVTSMVCGFCMFMMALTRKDKRHLGDFLAKTQVQLGVG